MKLLSTVIAMGFSCSVFAQGTQTHGTAVNNLDISNINATIQNGGDFFTQNPGTSTTSGGIGMQAGFEVPKGSGKHTIWDGALWIGGKDQQNNLYVASQTYRQGSPPQAGFWPGPIGTVQDLAHSNKYNKIWKVNKAQIQNHISHYNNWGYITPPEIANWPGNGNTANGEAAQLAPFIDKNNDGIYSPAQGDYPDIKGDQAVYLILNDKGNFKIPGSPSMNAEIHVMYYGYNTPANTAVYNTIFSQYRIINRGQTNFKDFYAGIFTDIDLGFYNDDFVGCDYSTNRYYGYNGDPYDDLPYGYGLNPPTQSVIFLDKQMSHFLYYNNDSNPTNGNPDNSRASDYYNYLKGIWKDGKLMTYGGNGTDQTKPPYKFMFPGISDTLGYGFGYTPAPPGTTPNPPIIPPFQSWTEFNIDGNHKINTPSDRRGLGSIGPFNLNAGQELKFTVAYTFTGGSPNVSSMGQAQQDAIDVQNFFRNAVIAGNNSDKIKQPLLLFPNPATDQLTIQLPSAFENKIAEISITDNVGRKVLEKSVGRNSGNQVQLNIESLSKGMYQVTVTSGEKTITAKLAKL